MNNELNRRWREALLLPGETELSESGVRELAEYFGLSRSAARQACEEALHDSKREWEAAPRTTPQAIEDFYRTTRSYLFEHVWWHATDLRENTVNVVLLDYARSLGANTYLDFGAGVGANAILFAQHGFKVTLADLSPAMLDFARWRLERRKLKADFIDLNRQSLPDEQFEFVTAVDVLEHLVDPAAALQKLSAALVAGGTCAFNFRAGYDPLRPMHILPTPWPVLRALRRNGFRKAGASAASLRKLDFYVVERGTQSHLRDWCYGVYDQLRYSEALMTNGDNGRFVPHPQQLFFKRVKEYLSGSGLNGRARWLDVGCGRQMAPWWLKGGAETEAELKSLVGLMVGIDRDLVALRDNRSLSTRLNADAVCLPFADASFDLTTSNMVFEHVEAPRPSLAEIRRVLRPGGRSIILTPNWLDIVTLAARVVPNRWHPAIVSRMEERGAAEVYPTHFRFNRPATVEKLLREAGFTNWRIELLEHPDVYSHVPVVAGVEATWHKLAYRWPALRGMLLIEAEAD
jgi:ubiquinone/menaquinone biosynthesis C-methylase UbiE